MPKIEKKSQSESPKDVRIFTEEELQKFHDELHVGFMKTDILSDGTDASYVDTIKYHKSKGTLNDDGAVTIQVDGFGDMMFPTRYERLEEKFRQYKEWLGRKEYGNKMRLQELDDMAKQINTEI